MNYKIAREILELDEDFTIKELRKSYFKKCLIYHPDKNINGQQMFQKTQEAYEYLQNNKTVYDHKRKHQKNGYSSNAYSEVFKNFIYSIKPDFFNTDDIDGVIQIINKLIRTLIDNSDEVGLKIIEKLDEETCNKVYQFISNHKDVFNISSTFLIKMRESINKRFECVPTIILKPEIIDLLNSNIFIYEQEDIKYYIPLWHQELYFKHHIVHIHPEMPDDTQIDNDNNITVTKRIQASDILKQEAIEVYLQEKLYIVHRSDIKLIEFQKIIICNNGIPKINERDIYDVSKKGDIILELFIIF